MRGLSPTPGIAVLGGMTQRINLHNFCFEASRTYIHESQRTLGIQDSAIRVLMHKLTHIKFQKKVPESIFAPATLTRLPQHVSEPVPIAATDTLTRQLQLAGHAQGPLPLILTLALFT